MESDPHDGLVQSRLEKAERVGRSGGEGADSRSDWVVSQRDPTEIDAALGSLPLAWLVGV